MKLLEKFSEIIGFESTLRNNLEKSKTIHKIADDYAIEFAEWIDKIRIEDWINKTTEELLQIFKKEKGL